MSKNHKKVFTTLNYIAHYLILASTVTGCIPISAFASLLGIPVGSQWLEKKKKHNKIVLLAKSKLNTSLNLQGFNWFKY